MTTPPHSQQSVESGLSLMTLDDPQECEVVARLNRFVVIVGIKGRERRAHINNTGRLEDFLTPGRRAYCLRSRPGARTDFKLFAVEDGDSAAFIDTQMQMRAFEAALDAGLLPWLSGARLVRRDVRLGASLIDYLLDTPGGRAHLEVKSAVLRDGPYAMYPDCPTARGRRHLAELTGNVEAGGSSTVLFIAALPRITAFTPHPTADPELKSLLIEAALAGVEVRAIGMVYQPDTSRVVLYDGDLRVYLEPGDPRASTA